MKLIVRRYANSKADIIGFVKIGNDYLTLLKKGTDLKGILNGCEILSSDIRDKSHQKIASLTGNILAQLCKKNESNQLILYKSHWSNEKYPATTLLNTIIPRIPKGIKVAVKSRPREDVKDFLPIPKIGTSIDSEHLSKNLFVFMRKTANMSVALSNAVRVAQIITGRKLVGTMWGANKTQKFLDSENRKVASLRSNLDTINMHQELMFKGIEKLRTCINEKSLGIEKRRVIARIVIPNIVDSYCEHKKYASDIMLELAPLLHVDEVFKNNTNYPASWFIDEEVLDNLLEDFEHLASYLGEVPIIESKVIIPLDMLGSQIAKIGISNE